MSIYDSLIGRPAITRNGLEKAIEEAASDLKEVEGKMAHVPTIVAAIFMRNNDDGVLSDALYLAVVAAANTVSNNYVGPKLLEAYKALIRR